MDAEGGGSVPVSIKTFREQSGLGDKAIVKDQIVFKKCPHMSVSVWGVTSVF